MLAVKNNIMAANSARHLGRSYDALAKSVERLSSGLRINSARDDAAGLAVRELIRADIAQFAQGSRNAQDAISMLQTTEGAMQVIDELLIRMKELAEQAATGSYSDEQRAIMDAEYGQLGQEITRIAQNTAFNGINLLATGGNTYGIHIGSTTMIDLTSSAMTAAALGVSTTGVKEAYLSDRGRATSYASNFIADSEISAATADMINFKFGATGTLAQVDLSAYASSGISLDLLVDEVNTAWQAQVASGEQVAFAYFDSDAAQWKLKVEDPTAEAEAFTLDNTNAIASFDELSEWTELASGVAGATVSLTDTTKAANALAMVTTAITAKDSYRAKLGYLMNRLDAAVNVLNIQAENLLSAESRISDVDVATEMAAMTRNQVLAQAGVSMLAQANSMPQMALKLLG